MNPIAFAALTAALLAPLCAAAAPRGLPPAPATRAPAPPPSAAPVAAPFAAADEAPAAEWRAGPGLLFEFGMGDLDYSAPKVRIEAERALRRVSPITTLSFVGSLSLAHASGSEEMPVVIPAFPFPILRSATLEWDANVFEVIPAARLTYASSRTVAFFAEGGLGLVYTAAQVHLPPAAASANADDTISDGLGGVVRLAGGLVITPSPSLRIGVEVIGLHLRFGDGPGTGFALGAILSHRL